MIAQHIDVPWTPCDPPATPPARLTPVARPRSRARRLTGDLATDIFEPTCVGVVEPADAASQQNLEVYTKTRSLTGG